MPGRAAFGPRWRIASALWADRSTSKYAQRSRRKRTVLRETADERGEAILSALYDHAEAIAPELP